MFPQKSWPRERGGRRWLDGERWGQVEARDHPSQGSPTNTSQHGGVRTHQLPSESLFSDTVVTGSPRAEAGKDPVTAVVANEIGRASCRERV